jgi:hypothetical protein
MARWCFVLLAEQRFAIFVSITEFLESQNVTESTTEGDGNILGNIRDFMDNTYMYISSIPILRILKTVGVALGVALATFFIAPIALFLLLCCIGFTCSGNNEIIAVPSSPICVLILSLLLKAFWQLRVLQSVNRTLVMWRLEVVFLVHRVWALVVAWEFTS